MKKRGAQHPPLSFYAGSGVARLHVRSWICTSMKIKCSTMVGGCLFYHMLGMIRSDNLILPLHLFSSFFDGL